MNHKKNWIIVMTLSLAIITLMGSCATAPELKEPIVEEPTTQEPIVEEPTIEEPVAQEPVVEEVDETLVLEALAKVKVAKEDAIDARAPRAASEEYSEGEQFYSEGLKEYTNGNLDAATEFYNLATEVYRKSIITANEQKELALAALKNAEAAIARTEQNANIALAKVQEEDNE